MENSRGGDRHFRNVFGLATGLVWAVTVGSATRSDGNQPNVGGKAETAHTVNFVVVSRHAKWSAENVAAQCEQLRLALYEQWCPVAVPPVWIPRAMVVVHRSEGDYLRDVGCTSGLARGVSKVHVRGGQIVSRRIDLMADPLTGELTALAHELTHLVLAACFPTRRLPRWADEGMALWADQARDKGLHRRTVQRAIERHDAPTINDTLMRVDYPSAAQLPVFYGQSLMLVEFLVELDKPERVVEFALIARERGYDHATRQVYGLSNMADLQRRWLAHVRQSANAPAEGESTRQPVMVPVSRKRA